MENTISDDDVDATNFLQDRSYLHSKKIKEQLAKANRSMKKQEDVKCSDKPFEVNDVVLVKLHKYRHGSLANHSSNKFNKRLYGPSLISTKP